MWLGDINSQNLKGERDILLTSMDLKSLLSPSKLCLRGSRNKIEGYMSSYTKELIISLLYHKYHR